MNGGEELDSPKEIKWETELSEPVLADRWILSKFNRVALDVSNALAEYRLHEAAATAYHFFWDDFCDWYIELSKPHVTSKDESDESRAVKRRIIYILEKALRLLHPFMPFITEELWHRLPHSGETIALAAFPTANAAELDGRAEKEMEFVIELITRLRSIRSVFNIAPSQSIQVGIATTDDALRSLIVTTSDYIERLARVSKITLTHSLSTTKGYARTVVGNAEIEVPLEGLIDFDKERKRLDGEITKLNGEQQGLRKRLENPDFVSRAAPDVVATTRAREEEISGQISRLSAIIEGF
jgi:valyl-tRNA synthetase